MFFIRIQCDKKALWHLIFGIKDKLSPERKSEILPVDFVTILPVSKVREGGFRLSYGLLHFKLRQEQLATPLFARTFILKLQGVSAVSM
jgi:hypothetical protein